LAVGNRCHPGSDRSPTLALCGPVTAARRGRCSSRRRARAARRRVAGAHPYPPLPSVACSSPRWRSLSPFGARESDGSGRIAGLVSSIPASVRNRDGPPVCRRPRSLGVAPRPRTCRSGRVYVLPARACLAHRRWRCRRRGAGIRSRGYGSCARAGFVVCPGYPANPTT
jgi:hypothetical protein